IPRYYYDAFNKRCRLFTYSGCGGNANNFQTFDQCNKECKPKPTLAHLHVFGVTADVHIPKQPRRKGDKLSYFVLSLSYVSPEICTLPPKVGKCKASFLRFYFNAATGNCEGFIYGGCGGNKNNFVTLGQCRATCQRSGKEEILIFASTCHKASFLVVTIFLGKSCMSIYKGDHLRIE
uniref:BPTI/Kunitz inhibitor domain-containing protein n=1 Tax=Naja naja TaxID=35670 RepID=A0A8C6XD17_NAJNA